MSVQAKIHELAKISREIQCRIYYGGDTITLLRVLDNGLQELDKTYREYEAKPWVPEEIKETGETND